MAMTMIVATVVTASISMTAPAIPMPMVTVFGLMAVADDHLIAVAPVTYIPGPDIGIVYPRGTLVYHYLVAVIDIVVAEPARKVGAVYPNIVPVIHILVSRNIVISIYIRNIVIIDMVVTDRPPLGLNTNVYP